MPLSSSTSNEIVVENTSEKIQIENWNTAWDNSNSTDTTISTDQIQIQGPSTDCNESLKHSHEQKAVFHGMKSAFRLVSTGEKGVGRQQLDEALRIAGNVGKAFLQTEDAEYDEERSEEYLADNFLDEYDSKAEVVEHAITRAWEKIDSGSHVGGARIAVSVADHYLGYEPTPDVK